MKNLYLLKRGGIFLLAAVMTITYIPIFGSDPAFASDDKYVEQEEVVDVLSEKQKKAEKDKVEAKAMAEMGVTDDGSAAADAAGDEVAALNESAPPQQQAADLNTAPVTNEQRSISDALIGSASADGEACLQGTDLPDKENFTLTVFDIFTNGDVEIDAAVNESGWTFSRMCIDDPDDTIPGTDINGLRSFHVEFNLEDYDVGYHTFILRFSYNGQEVDDYYYWERLPRHLYDGEVPSIQHSDFATGKSYFKYYNDGNYCYEDDSCGVIIEYKKGNGEWKHGSGPVDVFCEKKQSGLSAATAYKVRASFCKAAYYDLDGNTYLFTGPTSDPLTIKTAYSKPPVKAVKISKVKVKCKKYRYWTGKIRQRWLVDARTGRKIRLIKQWKIYRTVRYYSTRYKVTVKFKKKPGIAGIQLRTSHGYTVWLGGNKTAYSKTFTVSGKKKGKRLTVKVRALMSKKYSSWSGNYKKRVKIR